MRAFYLPAWAGDHRLVEDGKDASKLIVHDPTAGELKILENFLSFAQGKGWTSAEELPTARNKPIKLSAPVSETGLKLAKLHHERVLAKTIVAVAFTDGKVEVETLSDDKKTEELTKKADEDKDSKAVATKRATPCCPQCIPGVINLHANEVLESFLSPQQLTDWREHHIIEVEGGLTHHRYLLAHRHTPHARKWGRICFDADDRGVVHFYDWTTPPEEEVLAAKLVMEHREDWLRNESTCFGGGFRNVFKNPFGGFMDGTETGAVMRALGSGMQSFAAVGKLF